MQLNRCIGNFTNYSGHGRCDYLILSGLLLYSMRNFFSFFWVWLFVSPLAAQTSVRIEISALPGKHPAGSEVYIAGSFNRWNPKDEKFRFQQTEKGNYFISLQLAPGQYEYKITRGGWDKVECKKNGTGIDNRVLRVETDNTVELIVEAWKDQFAEDPKLTSTAGKNVHIIDTAFRIEQLNRKRRIWIYLPDGYSSSRTRYPVLYMHDGQNIFDIITSYAGEWGVDECIDTMMRKCIVVGIDNGGDKRLNEYCPYDFTLQGFGGSNSVNKGEGDPYVDFLVKTLKPYIDEHYRTLKNKKNTFTAGSSMGGLISLYATLKYPKVFGGAGVFSPAFWVAPKIYDAIKTRGKKVNAKIYFYAGKQESESMVPDMLKAFEGMNRVTSSKMITVIRDDGKHNEPTWRKEFPLFYNWILE